MDSTVKCSLCNDTRHCRVLEGEGTAKARWVFKACVCVVKERWRLHLGAFATAPKISGTPLLQYGGKSLFCPRSDLLQVKAHVNHFLRRKPLEYQYRALDIPAIAALYVSHGGEGEEEGDTEVYRMVDLVILMLNLSSIRSVKADDLLCRAIQYRILASKPIWIFYGGSPEHFQKEFEKAHILAMGLEQVDLRTGVASGPTSQPAKGPGPSGLASKYNL